MKSDKTTPNVPTLRFPNYNGEWQKTVMGKVCSFRKGYGIAKDDLSRGGTPCILYGELYTTYKTAIAKTIKSKTSIQSKSLVYSQKDDVIIPCSGETAEDIATSICVPYDGVLLGGDLTIVHSDLDGAFLSNQINSVRKFDIARIAQGKSIVHLQADELKKIFIFYPSIQEQRKISAFIDKIDERIEIQNKIISKYETLIKGLCDMIFPSIEGSILPLKAIVSIEKGQQINGMSLAKTGKYYYLNGGIAPSGYIDDYNTSEETISISEGGNSCGFVSYNLQKFWSGGHCYTLKIMAEQCRSKYLFFYLKYKEKDIMQLRVGSGLPNIQKKSLENFNVKLPNYKKQCFVERVFEVVTAKKEIENALLERFQSQKKFLLSKMFI
jgi:type I restriction enzyme S subunit